MPRVKIDYIVSFSSEDPEHPASNLLLREVSKKKWLCRRGESTCSVVLQLPRTVKITGVHIGSHHAALVEVLVGRSETSTEEFQVLVPSSVFLSREESRRDAAVQRVRSFGAASLSAPARDQRWDRVRLVCSQPHNKHCQFGLSFVHVDEAETGVPGAVAARLLALDALSSDEDDFKPGELFAKHVQSTGSELPPCASGNTGAQIRHATSQALKNIAESSTKLLKTPISKPVEARAHSPRAHSPPRCQRARDELLYTRDDAAPHQRIDTVLSRHDQNKTKHDSADRLINPHQKTKESSKTKDDSNVKNKAKDEPKRTPKRNKSESPQRAQRNHDSPPSVRNKDKEARKRRRSSSQQPAAHELLPGPLSAAPHTLLRGAALVLSGYENPRRAAVRTTALALGARVLRDWERGATHLICAFPNTPKLRGVRAAAGDAVPVARAEWLDAMCARRRMLPWQWFATEARHLVQPAPHLLRDDDAPASEGDTDDEIEKVLQAQKKRRLTEFKTSDDAHGRDDSPAASTSGGPPPCDADDDVPTDDEAPGPPPGPRAGAPPGPRGGALPDFFDGLRFAIDAAAPAARLMARYVLAYGGLVLSMSEVEEGSEVDYIVRGRAGGGAAPGPPAVRVSPAWLAGCHRAQALLPHS